MAATDQRLQGALPGLEKLSTCVYLYRPSSVTHPSQDLGPAPPKLILFATWMSARDAHIAKYFARYQELYPSSQILLIKTGSQLFTLPDKIYREIEVAVPVIRQAVDVKAMAGAQAAGAQPQLLAHLSSNGGSVVMENLYRAYRAHVESDASTKESSQLPSHVKIFDSAPGEFGFKLGVAAMTAGVTGWWQRLFAVPMVYLVVLYYWLPSGILGRPDKLARTFEEHNKRDTNGQGEVRRVYIYSDKDKLIDRRSVEKHADQAEKAGFDVKRELFKGSSHVAHMRSDPDRYWRIVKETWEGTTSN